MTTVIGTTDGHALPGPPVTLMHASYAACASLTILVAAMFLVNPQVTARLTDEDASVEALTALAFAASALVCGIACFRSIAVNKKYLLLWLLLSVCFAGEEISWGQRILGFSTPEFLSSNVQGEFNLHNLPAVMPKVVNSPIDLLTSQGLFYLGFLLYFLIAPVVARAPIGDRLAKRIQFPLPPVRLLMAIWIPVVASFLLALATSERLTRGALTETRELCLACGILQYVLWMSVKRGSRLPADSANT